LPDYLEKHYKNKKNIELKLFVGNKERIPVRLIAFLAPQETIRAREKQLRKTAHKKGTKITDKAKKWIKYTFFITNVPDTIWKTEIVGTIYRIRWEIELIFKRLKSQLKINILKGTRPERIKCLIYGRLIFLVLLNSVYNFASIIAKNTQREASPKKVIEWLLRDNRFIQAIYNNTIEQLLQKAEKRIKRMCKQERERKTILEMIDQEIEFIESYDAKDYYSWPIS
jgi:hypothetical protein